MNLAWLERGIVVDINNTANPKPFRRVECGRQLPQATGSVFNSATSDPLFLVNWFPNSSLYYGTWGDTQTGNTSFGNNPIAGSIYTPLLGAGSSPANPIMQIQDANGNLLVLTGFGTEGTAAPVLPALSLPGTTVSGTGATTVWTVVDPNGMGFRVFPPPPQTGVVWQFNLWGQANPIRFTSLQQTLAPLPDTFETTFRQGFIAQAYRYSVEAKVREKFEREWALWLKILIESRAKSDRELEENMFVPNRGIFGGGGINSRNNTWPGASWPFNLPTN